MSTSIVVATFSSGATGYYTGKAGPEWLSLDKANAFRYSSIAEASGKAKALNHIHNMPESPAFSAAPLK